MYRYIKKLIKYCNRKFRWNYLIFDFLKFNFRLKINISKITKKIITQLKNNAFKIFIRLKIIIKL